MPGIPCPSCQAYIVPGSLFCGKCGHSFVRQAVPESGEPVCSVHPDLVSVQACERCGAFSCAKCLSVGARGEALCAKCIVREPAELLPWDRREELGLLKAFWKTCVEVMLRPTVTFERVRPDGSIGSSLGFVALAWTVGMLTTFLLYGLILAFMPWDTLAARDAKMPSGMFMRGTMIAIFFFYLLLIPVLGAVGSLVLAGIDHLVLRMAGVTQQTYSVTLRAHALSMGVYLAGLVPLCSAYVIPFWSLGIRVVAYRSMHRTTWGKGALGALVAPVGFVVLGCGFYLAMVAFFMSALPSAR
ncbi:YIP1 family protein [Myxococcus sp. K15C18031901]|uniref:YIP1 family protein n=1 Tax=Myxococcus dinghuensis TaxID=2906761 RepID=UPI0020A801C7|nr:YIP1 family protein [Myxococcus dinghuensis]MCP3102586.1 YIP1 family protein [Myxococcus dinghuensis]